MRVLFLKEATKEYQDTFVQHQIAFLPPLSHSLLDLKPLEAELKSARHAGIILSSQRAAEALNSVMNDECPLHIFAVGDATAKVLRKVNPSQVSGTDSGDAAALAAHIVQVHSKTPFRKPLLFLVGAKTRETLPLILSENNIPFQSLQVYETTTASGFKEDLTQQLEDFDPECLVFFSPSGVDATFKCVHVQQLAKLKLLAIGGTTLSHLKDRYSCNHVQVAAHPTSEAVLQLINSSEAFP